MRALVDNRPTKRATYQDLRAEYGSNAAIADAVGRPTAQMAERDYRRTRKRINKAKLARVRSDARRRRSSFLRDLERYQRGTQKPGLKRQMLFQKLADATRSIRNVAQAFYDLGVTLTQLTEITYVISNREVTQHNVHPVAFRARPDFVDAVQHDDWQAAADSFWTSWGFTYIGDFVFVQDVEGLELDFGIAAGAYSDRGRVA